MIIDALNLIKEGLQAYIIENGGAKGDIVVIDNIAMADELGGTSPGMNEKVIMTLVNMEEEVTLKNSAHYRSENSRTIYRNPPVNLNLFILFSVLNKNNYNVSISLLSRIVEFFQWQKEFSFTTQPITGNISRDVKVFSDLYTLSFEELNQLWGSLGGKQIPFVLYRFRCLALEAKKRQAEGKEVGELSMNE